MAINFLYHFRMNKFCENVQYNKTASWPINSLYLQSKINEMVSSDNNFSHSW